MTGEVFKALLAPNLPSLRRFVQTRLRISDHADDVVQQTLLRAFSHRHQLRADCKFKSWLCSIAMNEVRLFFRTGRPTISLDEFPQIDSRDSAPSPLARSPTAIPRRHWPSARSRCTRATRASRTRSSTCTSPRRASPISRWVISLPTRPRWRALITCRPPGR